ncbi:bifunctional DNA primase/polymerase [Miltoncostaea marina]|uniref:bifunctional DNA primase/polymerase n=1 Tax=Miltoncostaea marina TaxID=2843215 RepID=UPI001FE56F37|nr:bifunctional DNA primase/polymerase [Miltoncostaea marina]
MGTFAEAASPFADGRVFGTRAHVLPVWWAEGGGCGCPDGAACEHPAKHPITARGLNDATDDLEQIAEWAKRYPQANIGLALAASGLCALDVDGEEGRASLRVHPESIPCTTLTATGRGAHLIYRVPPGRRARGTVGVAPGLDLRGRNYVLVPPSVHASGVAYCWDVPPRRVATDGVFGVDPEPAPEWMLIAERAADTVTAQPSQRRPVGASRYGWAAALDELRELASTAQGGRNDRLNQAAFALGGLVAGGELAHEPTRDVLLEVALAIGLGRIEAEKTIASGLSAGAEQPRSAPARA